jgi:hypothetical protein
LHRYTAALRGIRLRPGLTFEKGDGSVRAAASVLSKLGFRRSWWGLSVYKLNTVDP